jgi:hypothetical protein
VNTVSALCVCAWEQPEKTGRRRRLLLGENDRIYIGTDAPHAGCDARMDASQAQAYSTILRDQKVLTVIALA